MMQKMLSQIDEKQNHITRLLEFVERLELRRGKLKKKSSVTELMDETLSRSGVNLVLDLEALKSMEEEYETLCDSVSEPPGEEGLN